MQNPPNQTDDRIAPDQLYTPAETAMILGIACKTLVMYRLECRGSRVIQMGRPRYRGSDQLAYIEEMAMAS